MPFKTTINITDSNECATSYGVEIKRASDLEYQTLNDQLSLPIVVEGLEDMTDYNVRITRRCCNGTNSDPVVVDVTGMSPMPTGFTVADMGGGDVYLEWNSIGGIDDYVVERSASPDYSAPDLIYTGSDNYYFDAAVGSGTHYYRVKTQTSSFDDSSWATYHITIA